MQGGNEEEEEEDEGEEKTKGKRTTGNETEKWKREDVERGRGGNKGMG